VVATNSARSRPAIDCFPRIMYGSYGDPRVSLDMDLMLDHAA
jgi:hypothetical protein